MARAAGRRSAVRADAGPGLDVPLVGQHAIVTGGGRGIGVAVAAELGRLGADLTLMGRTRDVLQAAAARLEDELGRTVRGEVMDVTDPEQVERAFSGAAATLGSPSILVNNAGAARSAPFARTDAELWQEMIELNLTSTYLCTQQALPGMLAAGYGRIVNMASIAGLIGYAYVTAYCAAKHGVVGLTRALAREVARTGVTVNAVCPGYTETEMVARAIATIKEKTGRTEEQARAELASHNPQGRLVEPAEVAQAVGWLCLPSSSAITGQAIAVAGGEGT
jgi:NAD(P)-dependent dehydrogenase (short-subunit alcohol dehydrogenase family)